jgi:hypothetical protein
MSPVIDAPALDETDELRAELTRLDDAICLLTLELDQARGERDRYATRVGEHRDMLGEALRLRFALEARVAAAEAEAGRQRARSEIRGRLLADIADAGLLGRRAAIARAVRVERLLAR